MLNLRSVGSILKGIATKQSPYYVQYYIIAQCHLACRMCNIVEANSDMVPAKLQDVEKIAKNLRRVGAAVVLLTGGEPFLHKEIAEIVKIFVSNGLSPRLQTAGIATHEQLQLCYDNGARHINVSLDSLVEAKQDYINGNRKGSWRQALEAVSRVNGVFRDRRRLCALGCVLSKLNYKEIPAILEFATRIGWWVSVVPVHITSSKTAMNFRGTDPRFIFSEEDHAPLDELLETLRAMKRSYLLFDSIEFLKSAIHFVKTGETTWRRFNGNVCDSPNLYFAVLPNGDFSICCDHRYQGRVNVADAEFPRIYRSAEFREGVLRVTSACSGCNYGSYPEITLLARDKKALYERGCSFLGMRNPRIPRLDFDEISVIAQEVRDKYGIVNEFSTTSTPRPPALSQRYGENRMLNRSEAVREWMSANNKTAPNEPHP